MADILEYRYGGAGEEVHFTAGTDLPAGTVINRTGKIGVVKAGVKSGEKGAQWTGGVFQGDIVTTALADGVQLYWDDTAKGLTDVVGTNWPAGHLVGTKGAGVLRGFVKLNAVASTV